MGFSAKRLGMVVLLFSFLFASCAQNLEMQKQQSASSRRLGEEFINQGDFAAALRELLKAEKLFEEDPVLQNDLGVAYVGRGKPSLAIPHYQKALALKPDFGEARNNLGVAYMKMGKWQSAIPCFEVLVEDLLYATPHFPLANLGWAYYNLGELKKSEDYYLKAIELQPKFVKAIRGLGITYMAMGDGRRAVSMFNKAVDLYPSHPQFFMDLARAYEMTGDRKGSLAAYKKVMDLDPGGEFGAKARKAINP